MDEENLNNMSDNTNNNELFNEPVGQENVGMEGIPTTDNNLVENENADDNTIEDEEDSNLIKLKDEAGNDVYFEFLDLIEYEGENYVILLPANDVESEDSDEVVILKEDKEAEDIENGQESYVSVDDEETLNKVFDIFKEKFKDEFNFVDDDNNN